MSSSSVMQGEAECGESGMTLGEGAGLLTMWTLTEGLWGKLEMLETEGGTETRTLPGRLAVAEGGGGGGGSGGGGGGGGGVAFLRSGDEDAAKEMELLCGRPPPPPPGSFGVEKSRSISATSCELPPPLPPPLDVLEGRTARLTLADAAALDSACKVV